MAEYINREAALKVLAEEAVFYARKFKDGEARGYMGAKASIEMIPAADVAEVVRCKDCKHCDFGEWQFAVCAKRSEYHNFTVRKNEFCNFGERRESE